ncbi:MAG TPA: metallophosphoesterase family protein [Phycisphaerae bacterium]|nr:metallophosphoesterase family protein [Phycisphaerales bacterium]HNO79986.1 metallophosphoesterase family protein [Phycisphaerae bacterium]
MLRRSPVYAIISDIHGNYEALQAVLAEIDRRNVKEIYCLGDVIGYGASPKQCIDTVMERCEAVVCGNHDHAVFYEPSNFNVSAERACYWTRQVFEDEKKKSLRDRRWEFLGKLPIRHEAKNILMVHASPRRPVNEYLFAEDVFTNPTKILANFDRLEERHMACVVGHTHVPGVFLDDPYFDPPGELREPSFYTITEEEKAIINVGSVGQPRDRDVRACFVVVHEKGEKVPYPDDVGPGDISPDEDGYVGTLEFIRVEYDIQKAVQKALDTPELDDFLGLRLLEGR